MRYRQPGPAWYVSTGRWAKIGRQHYRHHSGAEVKKHWRGTWEVVGSEVGGDHYDTASAAMWNVERVTDRRGEGMKGLGTLDFGAPLAGVGTVVLAIRKAACSSTGRAAAQWSCGGEGLFSKAGRRLVSGAVAPPIAMACQVGGQKAVKGLLDKVCGASDERAQAAVDQVMQHGQKKEIPMGSLSAAFHGVATGIGADVSTPTYPGSTVTNLTAPSIGLLNALRAAGSKGWALSTFFRKATEYGFDAGKAHRFIQVAVSRGLVSQAVRGRISAR